MGVGGLYKFPIAHVLTSVSHSPLPFTPPFPHSQSPPPSPAITLNNVVLAHCVQTLADLMNIEEIKELDEEEGETTVRQQKQSEAEMKRRKLAEDMKKEKEERIRKKHELLKKEKEYEKVREKLTCFLCECVRACFLLAGNSCQDTSRRAGTEKSQGGLRQEDIHHFPPHQVRHSRQAREATQQCVCE